MGLKPMRKSRTESLPEKQAVGIQWKRAWGLDSSMNAGMDSPCNLDQTVPVSGTRSPHFQNDRVRSDDAALSQQQQA